MLRKSHLTGRVGALPGLTVVVGAIAREAVVGGETAVVGGGVVDVVDDDVVVGATVVTGGLRVSGRGIRIAGLLRALLSSPIIATTQQRRGSEGVRSSSARVRPPSTILVAVLSTINVLVGAASGLAVNATHSIEYVSGVRLSTHDAANVMALSIISYLIANSFA